MIQAVIKRFFKVSIHGIDEAAERALVLLYPNPVYVCRALVLLYPNPVFCTTCPNVVGY